jgi:hypothetical protein
MCDEIELEMELLEYIILGFKEQKHLASFRTSAKTPGVFIPQTEMFRSSLPESAELVFYANNGQQNRRMIAENPGRKHIQLLHGDSDKSPSYSPLTKNYDYVLCFATDDGGTGECN